MAYPTRRICIFAGQEIRNSGSNDGATTVVQPRWGGRSTTTRRTNWTISSHIIMTRTTMSFFCRKMTTTTVSYRTVSRPHLISTDSSGGGRETVNGCEVWWITYPGDRGRAGSVSLPPRRGQRISRLQCQNASEKRGTRYSCTSHGKGYLLVRGWRDSKSLRMDPYTTRSITLGHNSFWLRGITQLHLPPSSSRIGLVSGPSSRVHI
jgi:hypothetical protein